MPPNEQIYTSECSKVRRHLSSASVMLGGGEVSNPYEQDQEDGPFDIMVSVSRTTLIAGCPSPKSTRNPAHRGTEPVRKNGTGWVCVRGSAHAYSDRRYRKLDL